MEWGGWLLRVDDRGEVELDTVQIAAELPRGVFSALRHDAAGFVRETRLATAAK